MTIKNPTLRRRTKGLSECAEDVRESRLLGYELKDVGNLIVTMTTHMTDLQDKVDSQAEHIKMLNKKLEQTPTDIVRCKDCKHWKDSDGVYRRGIGAESKCPINNSMVFEGTFCCADFVKRGNSDGSN